MRQLILSVDYEIFGNGTGDVRRHVLEPAERMARVCERHGVPLTIFLEAEEYAAFARHATLLKKDLGYDPAALIREQIISFIRNGHDVQLHLHPQWHGARYEDGQWRLNPGRTTVDALFETQEEATGHIANRKGLIDEMAAAAGSSRKVSAYRAGAFSAQPGRKLLTALAENNIIIDSSVVKGLRNSREGFDYRAAPSARGPWRVRENVAMETPGGPVWEFPIYSVMGRRFQQLTPTRLRAKFSRHVPKAKQRETMGELGVRPGNPFGLLKFLWQKVPLKLDYHNVSPGQLLRWIQSAPSPSPNEPDVLVLIGHTKEHVEDQGLENLLKRIEREKNLRVISLDALAALVSGKCAVSPVNCS